MKGKLYFKEEQSFRAVWIFVILACVNGLFIYALFKQILLGHKLGSYRMPNLNLLINEGYIMLFTIWLLRIKLIVKVYEEGIYYKFRMIKLRYSIVSKNIISSYKIIKYDPFRGFVRWTIRRNRKNISCTISGNNGIQLELNNGNEILFGTQKPKEFNKAIELILNKD